MEINVRNQVVRQILTNIFVNMIGWEEERISSLLDTEDDNLIQIAFTNAWNEIEDEELKKNITNEVMKLYNIN